MLASNQKKQEAAGIWTSDFISGVNRVQQNLRHLTN